MRHASIAVAASLVAACIADARLEDRAWGCATDGQCLAGWRCVDGTCSDPSALEGGGVDGVETPAADAGEVGVGDPGGGAAEVQVYPPIIDFGWVTPGAPASTPLTMASVSGDAVEVASVSLSPTSSPSLALVGAPGEPEVLEGSAVLLVDVVYDPTMDDPPTTSTIGRVEIESSGGLVSVNVFGRPKVAAVVLNPPEQVDLGEVPQGQTADAELVVSNVGGAETSVSALWIDAGGGEWALQWPGPGVLPSGGHLVAEVAFTNLGAASGAADATLFLETAEPSTYVLSVTAERAGAPECELVLVPSSVDFGMVPRGSSKTRSVGLANIGSGACSFLSAAVDDCVGWSCGDPAETLALGGDSLVFEVVAAPPAMLEGLSPGSTADLEVRYTPPPDLPFIGLEDGSGAHTGLLYVRYIDPWSASDDPVILAPASSNVSGATGLNPLLVAPESLAFGAVTVGCSSPELTVTVYSQFAAATTLDGFVLAGCPPSVALTSAPPTPVDVSWTASVSLHVRFTPAMTGSFSCALELVESDTTFATVSLTGGGSLGGHRSESFVQTDGVEVDVLFVVDDSGSMGNKQQALATAAAELVAAASAWAGDWRLGVVSTDPGLGGALQGQPRWLEAGAPSSLVAAHLQLGTDGEGNEQGLEMTRLALTPPNTSASTIPCVNIVDCEAPDVCLDATCGGPNAGFLRPDAALEVVFVSDEEDQSPGPVGFYADALRAVKGQGDGDAVNAHAIVGPPGGCFSRTGEASAGSRYLSVVEELGGAAASICEPEYSAVMAAIGESAFGPRTRFSLATVPDVATLEVKIGDAPCPAGDSTWSWSAPWNAVVFEPEGSCLPQPGQTVTVDYEALCFVP